MAEESSLLAESALSIALAMRGPSGWVQTDPLSVALLGMCSRSLRDAACGDAQVDSGCRRAAKLFLRKARPSSRAALTRAVGTVGRLCSLMTSDEGGLPARAEAPAATSGREEIEAGDERAGQHNDDEESDSDEQQQQEQHQHPHSERRRGGGRKREGGGRGRVPQTCAFCKSVRKALREALVRASAADTSLSRTSGDARAKEGEDGTGGGILLPSPQTQHRQFQQPRGNNGDSATATLRAFARGLVPILENARGFRNKRCGMMLWVATADQQGWLPTDVRRAMRQLDAMVRNNDPCACLYVKHRAIVRATLLDGAWDPSTLLWQTAAATGQQQQQQQQRPAAAESMVAGGGGGDGREEDDDDDRATPTPDHAPQQRLEGPTTLRGAGEESSFVGVCEGDDPERRKRPEEDRAAARRRNAGLRDRVGAFRAMILRVVDPAARWNGQHEPGPNAHRNQISGQNVHPEDETGEGEEGGEETAAALPLGRRARRRQARLERERQRLIGGEGGADDTTANNDDDASSVSSAWTTASDFGVSTPSAFPNGSWARGRGAFRPVHHQRPLFRLPNCACDLAMHELGAATRPPSPQAAGGVVADRGASHNQTDDSAQRRGRPATRTSAALERRQRQLQLALDEDAWAADEEVTERDRYAAAERLRGLSSSPPRGIARKIHRKRQNRRRRRAAGSGFSR